MFEAKTYNKRLLPLQIRIFKISHQAESTTNEPPLGIKANVYGFKR